MWNKPAPKVGSTEQVSVEETSCVGGTDWKVNVHTGEHLPYIGKIPFEKSGGGETICAIYVRSLVVEHVVEHNFIADGDAKDVLGAVGLQGLLQGGLLALIAGFVDVYEVDTRVNGNISLSLLDGLQDKGRLVAFGAVESEAGGEL